MKYCPDCRLDYPDTSKFCKSCGKALAAKPAQQESCPSCGSAMQAGWKFCKECGRSFAGVGAVSEQTANLNQAGAATVASADFSVTCVACGLAQASGEPLCKGCGRPFAQRPDSATIPAYSVPPSYAGAAPPVASEVKTETPPPSPPPPPTPVACVACGHQSPPDAERCEACGALVGLALKRKGRRRILVGAVATVIAVIVLACGLGVGWYFWGVTVAVRTDPADARVFIDDKEVGGNKDAGVGSLPHIRAGEHSLKVMRDGYDAWMQTFTIELTDFNKSLNVKLDATKFKLTVLSTPPGSEVLVDDVSVGTTSQTSGSFVTEPMKAGDHSVIVRHDGYLDWKQTVALKADTKIEATLSAPVFDASSMQFPNEASAIRLLHTIAEQETQYYNAHQHNNFGTFAELIRDGLLDNRFLGAMPVIEGYVFTLKLMPKSNAQQVGYSVNADPQVTEGVGATGKNHFYIDSNSKMIHANGSQPATAVDPTIGQ